MFSSVNRWIKDHDVLAFFALTFVISWGCWIPVVLSLPVKDSKYISGVGRLVELVGMWGPALAALIITGVTQGRAGITDLLRRLFRWRTPIKWYLIILLGWPAIVFLAAILFALATNQPVSFVWSNWPIIPSAFVSSMITLLAFAYYGCEELGWRGFALPRLLERGNALSSSLIIAIAWGLWHVPMFAWNIKGITPNVSFPVYLLDVFALSILMTWIFNNTKGSVFMTAMFHTWHNMFPYYQSVLLPLKQDNGLIDVRTLLLGVAALLVVVVFGYRTFTREQKSRVPAGLRTSEVQ